MNEDEFCIFITELIKEGAIALGEEVKTEPIIGSNHQIKVLFENESAIVTVRGRPSQKARDSGIRSMA